MPISEPAKLGRYELVERIAEGRTSEVFLGASHGVEGFRRTLVIKRLRPEIAADPGFVGRYLEQARRLFTLSHVNIVQPLDLGEADGRYFLAEEYVEGYDLSALREMASAGNLTFSAPIGLFVLAEIAKGVEYGHRRLDPDTLELLGLCHGDLHPRNILMGFEGQVKVADFGLYRPLSELDLSTDAAVLRAFSYAAPEVAAGEPPSQKSDLFSLGLLTVEFCAGRHPYRSRSAEEVRQKALKGKLAAPFRQTIPEPLQEFVDSALQPDPTERRVDMSMFYDRIISYLHRQYDLAGAGSLAAFVRDIGDVDLGTSVADSGMIASEPTMRMRAASRSAIGEVKRPDPATLWAFGSAPKPLPVTAPEPLLPEPDERPLGANGREGEIALIAGQADSLREGSHAIFVSGPRGVGKSHLLRVAHQALVEAGHRTVLVAPDADAADRPYATLLDILSIETLGEPLLWVKRPGPAA